MVDKLKKEEISFSTLASLFLLESLLLFMIYVIFYDNPNLPGHDGRIQVLIFHVNSFFKEVFRVLGNILEKLLVQ